MLTQTGTDAARTALALMTAAVDDRDLGDSVSDLVSIIDSLETDETPFILVALATLGATLAQELADRDGSSTRDRIQQLAITFETKFGVPSESDEV